MTARLLTPFQIVKSGGAYVMINSIEGAILTCGDETYTLSLSETYHIFIVSPGTYLCTASYGENTATATVTTVTGAEVTLKPSMIPSEYQEVAYLRFTGSQYINTGITPTNMETRLRINQSSYQNGSAYLGTDGGASYYMITPYNASGNAYWVCTDSNGNYGAHGAWSAGIKDIIYNKVSDGGFYVDGVLNVYCNNPRANGSLYVGKRQGASNLIGDIITFKMTNRQNSSIVFNGIPCYRKSDSVAGLYDTVSKTLFTNAGTGTFVVGADV